MLRYLSFLGGLVLWTSPLFAQEYIDLEAERLQQAPAAETLVPDSVQASEQDPGQASEPLSQPVGEASGFNAGELYYQLQLLQQEVMELRGKAEEQDYQIKQLKEQSLERYLDLDRRLKEGGAVDTNAGTTSPGVTPSGGQTAQEQAGESDAYRSAYSLVRSQQFPGAVTAFLQFLKDYPAGKYAANAHYWLGELYLVVVPAEPESARRQFSLLLEQFPDNAKVPDTLYKLGKIYFEKGNCARSREYLERVINEFSDSGSSAVKLARDLLSQTCQA